MQLMLLWLLSLATAAGVLVALLSLPTLVQLLLRLKRSSANARDTPEEARDSDTNLSASKPRPPLPALIRPFPCLSLAPPRTDVDSKGVPELVCMSGCVCELAVAGRLRMVSTLVGVAEGITSSNETAGCPAGYALLPVPDLVWDSVLNMATRAATLTGGCTKSGAILEVLGHVVLLQAELQERVHFACLKYKNHALHTSR